MRQRVRKLAKSRINAQGSHLQLFQQNVMGAPYLQRFSSTQKVLAGLGYLPTSAVALHHDIR